MKKTDTRLQPDDMSGVGRSARIIPWLVAAAAVLIYLPSMKAEWSGLDDVNLCINDAPALRSDGFFIDAWSRPHFPDPNLARIFYRPIVSLSYALDARSSGPETVDPAPFHRTNVLLHAMAGALLASTALSIGLEPAMALIGGLIFVAHPVLAVAVAWIPGRNDLLLAIFALIAFVAFVRASTTDDDRLSMLFRMAQCSALQPTSPITQRPHPATRAVNWRGRVRT